jgi:uncharacterized protein YbjQ (UPF0145 family)
LGKKDAMDIKMTTTAFDLPGFTIKTNLGMVRGILVRSRSIFGVRYDTTEVMSGVTEVICYGTAVIVE